MRTSAVDPAASSEARSLSGATTKNVAPCSVSGRVEKTVTLPGWPSISKSMSAPTDRPIQFRCIRMTF